MYLAAAAVNARFTTETLTPFLPFYAMRMQAFGLQKGSDVIQPVWKCLLRLLPPRTLMACMSTAVRQASSELRIWRELCSRTSENSR